MIGDVIPSNLFHKSPLTTSIWFKCSAVHKKTQSKETVLTLLSSDK